MPLIPGNDPNDAREIGGLLLATEFRFVISRLSVETLADRYATDPDYRLSLVTRTA